MMNVFNSIFAEYFPAVYNTSFVPYIHFVVGMDNCSNHATVKVITESSLSSIVLERNGGK